MTTAPELWQTQQQIARHRRIRRGTIPTHQSGPRRRFATSGADAWSSDGYAVDHDHATLRNASA